MGAANQFETHVSDGVDSKDCLKQTQVAGDRITAAPG